MTKGSDFVSSSLDFNRHFVQKSNKPNFLQTMTLLEKQQDDADIPVVFADVAAVPVTLPSHVPEAEVQIDDGDDANDAAAAAKPVTAKPAITATVRTVEVIAPSDLPAGFEFYVDDPAVPQTSLLVRVPASGARATQRFAAIVVQQLDRGSHNIPRGKWRDGLCDCCNLGCCHPQWCLTLWCRPCAVGQVLTRLKLNVCGSPVVVGAGLSAFQILFAVQIAYILLNISLSVVIGQFSADSNSTSTSSTDDNFSGTTEEDPGWLAVVRIINNLLEVCLYIFMLIVTMRLRRYVRNKYQIPENTCCCKEGGGCRGCEDFCCSFWCQFCTICQVARHTADYHRYPAGCCTEDGLASGTPPVV